MNPDQRANQSVGRLLGRVITVRGSQVTVGLSTPGRAGPEEVGATVGNFVAIRTSKSVLIGLITEVSIQTSPSMREQGYLATAQLDLLGEIKEDEAQSSCFRRGIADYPMIGDAAALITGDELRLIYAVSEGNLIDIGHLHQDSSVHPCVDVDEMLSSHFAVLGTTGVGKSSAIALMLQQILQVRPDLRIFLLDVHNEYGRCFGERAQVFNLRSLKLPFWLFNFEETIDVIFGGRPGVDEEVEILAELIPLAKGSYLQYRGSTDRPGVKRTDPKSTGYTADTPVPYRLADLVTLIDERMGKLENRSSRMRYHKLIMRIQTVSNDPRYAFMFENANVGGDTMAEVMTQLFRLAPDGKPMTVMQLAGFPVEVVDSVVSVLCRMAFEFGLWSDGAAPLLFVCEEAHRYASADRSIGFGPTRKAISRIAKEGRKYGVFLGLVTQRPAELDPTIISQCSTLFVMRMSNDRDQALLRSAISDAAANLMEFAPSLGTCEVLAFGQGVALPTRLTFRQLPDHLLPRSEALSDGQIGATSGFDREFIDLVLERWRRATLSNNLKPDAGAEESATAQSGLSLDPDRFKLLKKSVLRPG